MTTRVLQEPSDTTMERRLNVVILEDATQLSRLGIAQFVGVQLRVDSSKSLSGYAYRMNEDSPITLIGSFGRQLKKFSVFRSSVKNGMLRLDNQDYQDHPINADETNNAMKYLKQMGLIY